MTNFVKSHYAGAHRVMLGGVPCRVARLPVSEGGKALLAQSSREMCLPLPPRGKADRLKWNRQQAAAYAQADKLGDRSIDQVVNVQAAPLAPPAVVPLPVKPMTMRQPMKRAAMRHAASGNVMTAPADVVMADRMTIYGYCRVSTMTQADDGESLGVQERQIRGWAMMRGEDVADIIVERGVSGSVPVAQRPEGARLWKSARKGDTIVCARLDRLFRSALDALQSVEEMRKRGVSLVVIDSLGEITGNGMAKIMLTIAAAFAEHERDTIRERISTVKADQRERGRYLGGKIPFGFAVDTAGYLEEIEEEQTIISFARALRQRGETLRAIRDQIAAQHGRRLSLEAINRITG